MFKTSHKALGLYAPWQAIGIFIFIALSLTTIEVVQSLRVNLDLDTARRHHHVDSMVVLGLASVLIGLNRPHIYRMSRWEVSWQDVLSGVASGLIVRLLQELIFRLKGESFPSAERNVLAIVSVVLIIPILEELLCRGVLLGSLLANFRPLFGILLTTCIVAAFHAEFVWAFPGQLMLCILYVANKKSLPSTMICHVAMNALTYV